MAGRGALVLGGVLMICASFVSWARVRLLHGLVSGSINIDNSQLKLGDIVADAGAPQQMAVVVVLAGVLLVILGLLPLRQKVVERALLVATVVSPILVGAMAIFAIVDTSWVTSLLPSLTFSNGSTTFTLVDPSHATISRAPGLGVWMALAGSVLSLLGGLTYLGRLVLVGPGGGLPDEPSVSKGC